MALGGGQKREAGLSLLRVCVCKSRLERPSEVGVYILRMQPCSFGEPVLGLTTGREASKGEYINTMEDNASSDR